MNPDRLPPFSLEAEQAVLGAFLLATAGQSLLLNECHERGVDAAWFYDQRHQTLWWAIDDMGRRGVDSDIVTIHQWLMDAQKLDTAGGLAYISGLADKCPATSAVGDYLDILEDFFHRRRLIAVCASTTASLYAPDPDTAALLAQAERDILALSEARDSAREQALKPLLAAVIDRMEEYHRGHAQIKGLTTGLEYLDKNLCGMGGPNGNMLVLAGRPGTGKTAMAMDIAMHVALDYVWFEPELDAQDQPVLEDGQPRIAKRTGLPVGIFSLEMSAESLVQRMLFTRAQADMQRWRTGFAENRDLKSLTLASGQLVKAQMMIDDSGRCTIDELKARARRWHRQYGIRLFIIDYVQLLRTSGRRFRDDRVQELAEISGEIQSLGKELQVPFLVLAQMNRDYEKDPNRTPRLSDLKDCGAIEQDADWVGFLYSPKLTAAKQEWTEEKLEAVYGKDWSKHPMRANLIVAKYRFGPSGVVELLFHKSCTKFEDWISWLKDHDFKDAAAGERRGDLPTNEEMEL